MFKLILKTAVLIAVLVSIPVIFAQDTDDSGEIVTIGDVELTVLPLSVVTESPVTILDITDTTARLNFIGTEPLACYLHYGTDDSYGAVVNDPNMSQSAIIEHNPVMFDLEPDTEYIFRMQGFGEDGVLYVSEQYSFRTLPASTEANNNLLSPENGATVIAVSSNFGNQANDGRWGILNAFDNNNVTEWSSNGDGDDAFFEVDLGGTFHINSIEYQTRAMSDGTAITESFTVTDDAGTVYGPFDVSSTENVFTFEVDITTSTLRYDIETSTGGNTGIIDIAAFGEAVE